MEKIESLIESKGDKLNLSLIESYGSIIMDYS